MTSIRKKLTAYSLFTLLFVAASFSPVIPTAKTFAQLVPLDNRQPYGPNFLNTDPTQYQLPASDHVRDVDPETGLVPENNLPGGTVDNSTGEQGAIASAGTPAEKPKNASCVDSSFPFFHLDACVASIIYMIMWIVSWFLYLAGFIFDQCMQFTLNISDLMTRVPVVDIGWKIFRDLANIFFIFILLWIALSTILGFNSGKTKELIVHLVVVALLMNFSLFITKAIVDGSNIIALHFYNLIVTSNPTGKLAYTVPQGSMSGAFMEGLKIQTLYDGSAIGEAGKESRQGFWSYVGSVGTAAVAGTAVGGPVGGIVAGGTALLGGNVINWGKIILIGLFGSALMLIAAYVFLVGAVLMLVRAIVLMFVMMLSPLAFLTFAMPFAEKFVEPWREALIKQSIFAPAFMILSYVVVKTIQNPAFKGVLSVTVGNNSLASAFSAGSGGGVAMIVNFLLVIGLMLGCILVAKKLEVHGLELAKAVGAKGAMWVASGRFITTTAGVIGYGFRGAGRVLGAGVDSVAMGKKGIKGVAEAWKNPEQFGEKLGMGIGKIAAGAGKIKGRIGTGVSDALGIKDFKAAEESVREMPGTDEEKKRELARLRRGIIGERVGAAVKGTEDFGKYINKGAEKIAKRANAVELKKLFDNSTLGKTALGAFLSDQTFGRLLKAKFGGEESVEEAHKKDEEQESREFDVDRQREAVKASEQTRRLKEEMRKSRLSLNGVKGLKELKKEHEADETNLDKKTAYENAQRNYDLKQKEYMEEVSKIERAMNKQSNKGFLSMNKGLYQDPEIMQHVSFAKMQALLKDEHVLDNEEKEKAMEARWEEPHDMFAEYKTDLDGYEKEKQAHFKKYQDFYSGKLPADKTAADTLRKEVADDLKKIGKEPALDQTTRRMVRNIRSVAEFEALNNYFPEMFKNERFVERILQPQIDQIRMSDAFTSVEKEAIREAKSVSVWNASKRILGLDPEEEAKLPRAEQDRRREDFDKEYRKNPFKFVEKLKADDLIDGGSRYIRHLMGKMDIERALLGKTTEEIAKMPGRIWEMSGVLDQFESGRGYAFKPKDEGDKVPVIEHMLNRWNQKDASGKRAVSEANRNFLWEMVNKNLSSFTNLSGFKDRTDKPELWKGLQEIIAELSEKKRAILKLDESTPEYAKLKKEMEERWIREEKEAGGKGKTDINRDEDEDFSI